VGALSTRRNGMLLPRFPLAEAVVDPLSSRGSMPDPRLDLIRSAQTQRPRCSNWPRARRSQILLDAGFRRGVVLRRRPALVPAERSLAETPSSARVWSWAMRLVVTRLDDEANIRTVGCAAREIAIWRQGEVGPRSTIENRRTCRPGSGRV